MDAVASLLVLLAAAAAVAGASRRARADRVPGGWGTRRARRPRWAVDDRTWALAQRLGFRYSRSRDALVLRGIGHRVGPVLQRRPQQPAPPPRPARRRPTGRGRPPAAPGGRASAAPRGRPAAGRPARSATPAPPPGARTVALACLPLPARRGRPWQLTAVDVGAGYTWAALLRGAPPPAAQVTAFVQQVARQLRARGLRLDAVVVPARTPHRRMLAVAARNAGTRALRPRDADDGALAAARHQALARDLWAPLLTGGRVPPLELLERQLQRRLDDDNERPGAAPDGVRSPARALRDAAAPARPRAPARAASRTLTR